MKITLDEWRDHREAYEGFCTTCQDWTRDGTEPDAFDYECEGCGESTVVGAENALVMGYVEVEDE